MRILRVRLTNYRGIARREIEFPARGITVVEGPNEIGKSSVAEAIDLVLTHYDSTRRKEVLAIQPAGDDVGPEIEVEIETGPYRFVLSKRFLKQPATSLRVLAPKAEQHTGRPAHDRALAILDETLDRHLWEALRVQQGGVLGQAAFSDASSLARALDH
ncbi:MAG: AAA family ATPase, partial [Planctomycetota bacterium]|nr:AAA family ATPase [Planctomycetota bacterium]